MGVELDVDFLWIPFVLGGHNGPPYAGMRLGIRWQKYISDYTRCVLDVSCISVTYDATDLMGRARFSMSTADKIPDKLMVQGELVELLSGYRVLAVGRIVSVIVERSSANAV